jgi:NADH-dependent peroxiredoxin subunit F
MTYDLIILGGGPAGAAAAVYAARKRLTTLLVTPSFGGQSVVSETIYNWIGTPAISGNDLAKDLETHAREYVREGETLSIWDADYAQSVTRNDDGTFTLTTDTNKTAITKSILVTTGSSRKKLDIPGAAQFENKGVVYCASCDGPLFSGQNVAVIGGGNAGFESAAQLLAYCPSVTLVHRSESYKADEITVSKVLENPNMHAMTRTEPIEVIGEKFVTGLKVRNRDTNEETILPVGGVFVEVGQIPNTSYLGDLVRLNEYGNIVTDPRTQAASTEGIWAAGDVTDALYHQNNIAAGQAVVAIEDLYLWLKRQ